MPKEPHILVVDDNEGDVFFISESLKASRLRCSLSIVRDGVEAMNLLRRLENFASAPRPDLVIMDVNMPRMNGFEVLKEMKDDADLRSIPVVLMSGSNADEDVQRAYDLQASCYVNKPPDLDGMVSIVQVVATFWIKFATLPPRAEGRVAEIAGR